MKKKRIEKYNLKQIIQVIKDIYKVESTPDSWNLPVMYEGAFIRNFKSRIKKIKQFIK